MSNSLRGFLLGCAVALSASAACAADFPAKTVRIIVGAAAGGGGDYVARLLSSKLADKWGVPVVVENQPGADNTIGDNYVAHAAPDGYTLLLSTVNISIISHYYNNLNFNPITSFVPVSLVTTEPDILSVNSSLPVNSVKELIDYAKTRPGVLNFGSTGPSGPPYLEMEMFMRAAGIQMTNVNYNGSGPALVALLENEVQAGFIGINQTLQQVKAGKLKALAVSGTGNLRSPLAPDLPTLAETGVPDFDGGTWEGIEVPAGTPQNVVAKLNADIVAATKAPDVQKTLTARGFITIASSAQGLTDTIERDGEQWATVWKAVNTDKDSKSK